MDILHFIEDLNSRYFDGKLSEEFKKELEKLPIDRPDVYAFVERMCRFCQMANYPGRDLSLITAQTLGSLLARILPGAWEGRVPPITIPGRHVAMDNLMKASEFGDRKDVDMLDIGCGFPPYTTLDTVKAFPDWNTTGVDPSLPVYLVFDDQGNYATLDENKKTVYFQPAMPSLENWNELLSDSKATEARFEALVEELLGSSSQDPEALPRLEIDPIKGYETDRLKFKRGGIGQVSIEPKDIIRCFNVLFYFDNPFFDNALNWFSDNLKDNGILLIGANWSGSIESYYTVYRKEKGQLVKNEFAFSLDCIAPIAIVPWYANYDDDAQSAELMELIRIIRSDESFMRAFYEFHDADRERLNICKRDADGNYGGVPPTMEAKDIWGGAAELLKGLHDSGLNEKAAEVLRTAGLNARVNEVGHIAVSE